MWVSRSRGSVARVSAGTQQRQDYGGIVAARRCHEHGDSAVSTEGRTAGRGSAPRSCTVHSSLGPGVGPRGPARPGSLPIFCTGGGR